MTEEKTSTSQPCGQLKATVCLLHISHFSGLMVSNTLISGRKRRSLMNFCQSNQTSEPVEFLYKILVVGDIGTGKTSIIKRYVHNIFSTAYKSTVRLHNACAKISTYCLPEDWCRFCTQSAELGFQNRYSFAVMGHCWTRALWYVFFSIHECLTIQLPNREHDKSTPDTDYCSHIFVFIFNNLIILTSHTGVLQGSCWCNCCL